MSSIYKNRINLKQELLLFTFETGMIPLRPTEIMYAMLEIDFHFRFCIHPFWRHDLNVRFKFYQHPSIFVGDTAILRKFKMAVAAILNFLVHFRFFYILVAAYKGSRNIKIFQKSDN